MNRVILILLVSLYSISSLAQSTILRTNGERVKCKIIKGDEEFVYITVSEGQKQVKTFLKRDDIVWVKDQNVKSGPEYLIEKVNGEKLLCNLNGEDQEKAYVTVSAGSRKTDTFILKSEIAYMEPTDFDKHPELKGYNRTYHGGGEYIIERTNGENVICIINSEDQDKLYVTTEINGREVDSYLNKSDVVSKKEVFIKNDPQLQLYKRKSQNYKVMAVCGSVMLISGLTCIISGVSALGDNSQVDVYGTGMSISSDGSEESDKASARIAIGIPLTAVGALFTGMGFYKTAKYSKKYKRYYHYKINTSYIHQTPGLTFTLRF